MIIIRYPFDDSIPLYGRVLSFLQYAPHGQKKFNKEVYVHVQWLEPFMPLFNARHQLGTDSGKKYQSLVPKEFAKSIETVMKRLPLHVLQPHYALDEKEWDATDIILASTIVRKVFMHPIPNFDLPEQGGRIFFLNCILSFPCPIYAHLILNDPYVVEVRKAYLLRKQQNKPF